MTTSVKIEHAKLDQKLPDINKVMTDRWHVVVVRHRNRNLGEWEIVVEDLTADEKATIKADVESLIGPLGAVTIT